MSTDSSTGNAGEDTRTGTNTEWGKISLSVLLSILLATGAHYLLLAGSTMHPSLHALIGIVLFFVTGFVVFQLVMG
ncbi:hypothetical protein HALLA_00865 (plasmid) [Halostagnicola larsenii XH-48]|uniref:Uncharacterized protein n=1 Tax=Halostagnicola larsenii XH-48 TaxID=797299 RepID=W0JTC1_9EURY|nr:hypothetical protein [Halostagnicola larsenii]AHG01876.1 hypothetical protein HALLA_00865 [Halostagnicola larsenii XH-48]